MERQLFYIKFLEESVVAVTLIIVVIVSISIHHWRFQKDKLSLLSSQTIERIHGTFSRDGSVMRVLLVTAHPDDECMFFSPAIISLRQVAQAEIFILCLSTGDYYSQGSTRKRELFKSCHILGVPEDHVTVIDDRDLPDNPKVEWKYDAIFKHVQQQIEKFQIDMILTFDEHGVSGHNNHKAIFCALRQMQEEQSLVPVLWKLETVNVMRKYIRTLDLWISHANSEFIFVLNASATQQAKNAMFAHHSQLVWFRYLYVQFSRYMIINTLKPVLPSTVDKGH